MKLTKEQKEDVFAKIREFREAHPHVSVDDAYNALYAGVPDLFTFRHFWQGINNQPEAEGDQERAEGDDDSDGSH